MLSVPVSCTTSLFPNAVSLLYIYVILLGKGTSPEKEPWHRIVVVYFLGGCTYSEIAALRFLGKQRGNMLEKLNIAFNRVTCI